MPDTTLVQPISTVLAIFGVPVMWLALTVPVVIGYVNTLKVLAPKLDGTWLYPLLGFVVSAGYSWMTLKPDLTAIIAGTLGVWSVAWGVWVAAKIAATKTGARPA